MTDEKINDAGARKTFSFIPYRIKVESRIEATPKWYPLFISIIAIIAALVLGGIIIAIVGGDPIKSYAHIGRASFGSLGVFSDTLVKAIPLILVGLACSVAFRMKLWNIGAEGQFYLGAFGASAVVLIPILPPNTSPWILIPVMVIVGMAAGAIWGFIPGFLKARYNVNEIISTLMMNYIAVAWNNFFIYAVWSEGGFQMSHMFERNAWLPRLANYAVQVPIFRGLTVHLGLIFGIVASFVVWFILYRSKWGYEIRLIGDNPNAARYAGINIKKNIILVLTLSGALAGLAGMSEITGVVHRLQGNISPGYGFTGIIIA
ncbi:MAG: ABC transporter permease, partial [Anaerolineales bacterium]|nr:ABC transporter permease [Anaerolineales bacterium]